MLVLTDHETTTARHGLPARILATGVDDRLAQVWPQCDLLYTKLINTLRGNFEFAKNDFTGKCG
jgi:hypothetical protein